MPPRPDRRPVFVAAALAACHTSHAPPVTLRVSAAISLRAPLEDLARTWNAAHPDARVEFVFGASGDLASQIERGAPVALFASAAEEPVARLARSVRAERLCTLARNELVLIRRRDRALDGLTWQTLATHPHLARLALGLTPSVPAGVYAERALTALGTLHALRSRIVRGGNVRQVLDLVARDEADAGIVYATDVRGRHDVAVVGPAPASVSPPVALPLALVPGGARDDTARALGRFLCGPDARRTLEAHGFRAP